MPESLKNRILRRLYNLWPCYLGTGVHIKYMADDFRDFRIELPLNWRTRNYVGTIFGGSMYGAVDPVYMLMLIKNLGPGYEVWDKAASIRFRRPGRARLHAECKLDEEQIRKIRELSSEEPLDQVYSIDLVDDDGTICATVEKTVHIRKRSNAANPSHA
jgi:acyl-coenzyme A thioesterase PaaI-like protein